jgi:glycosyltransferase involved in cell wall biosynthesis
MSHKTAFISSSNPHPTSLASAKSVGCDIYKIDKETNDGIIKSVYQSIKLGFQLNTRYDIFLVESTLSIIPVLIRKYIFRNKCKIVHRANAGEYNLILGNINSNIVEKYISRFLLSKIDYSICISTLIETQVLKAFPNRKTSISETFVVDDTYFDITPDYINNNFIFVGNYFEDYDHKDIVGLINKFNKLYDDKIINSSLYILGRNTEHLTGLVKHKDKIKIVGYDDPKKYFNKCCYYMHNARFEAGGAIVLEAMASGLIPIVSINTGNKDFLEKSEFLQHNIFKENNFEEIIKTNYIMNTDKKIKIGKEARRIVYENASLKVGTIKFKEVFNK